jgi:hypothetical protein
MLPGAGPCWSLEKVIIGVVETQIGKGITAKVKEFLACFIDD